MDKENVCLYKLVIRLMYEEMDNAWIIEWAREFLSEGMSGRVSQWVSDEMREQSSEEADVCEIMRVNERMKKCVN